MLNISDYESQASLNDAFELIKGIFDKERESYEKTIKTLKNRISQLEDALLKANKENMKYQSKISDLKSKLSTISKTVSKLEDSENDFEIKKTIKENAKEQFINIKKENNYNNIKYRNNNERMNTFRKKTKFITNINRSVNDNEHHQLKNNFLENLNIKQLNNGEDIKSNYNNKTSKPNKKAFSYKIKNRLLNAEETEGKNTSRKNNLFKSYAYNGENPSIYLSSNGYNENKRNMRLKDDIDKRNKTNKIKYLSFDKYNQIEKKIKGIKSGLNIFKEKEETKLSDSLNNNSISIYEQNIFP